MSRPEVLRRCSILLAIVGLCLSAAPAKADLIDTPALSYYQQGGILTDSPDYDWWYGCSPTSAGMMMGYYDIHGYAGLYYDNLVPGGVAELSSYGNPGAIANQAIASAGHIADFYSGGYGASHDDYPNGSPHHSFNCLADFMGTSQDSVGNWNGATTFYYFKDGSPLHDSDAWSYGIWDEDGMYGIGEYITYAGYVAANLYTQPTDNLELTYGFGFDDYKNEIDDGRVVMLHVEGHSMFGYGYEEIGDLDTIYLYDTWSPGPHTMTWGGAYSGLDMWGVTVFELTGGAVVPVPAAVLLGMLGLGVAGLKLRKFA